MSRLEEINREDHEKKRKKSTDLTSSQEEKRAARKRAYNLGMSMRPPQPSSFVCERGMKKKLELAISV